MSNTVELIPQDKSNACWLASSSMMETWKTGKHSSLTDTLKVLDASGKSFSNIYKVDGGLSFDDNKTIVSSLGLTALPPASYTIEYLTSILDQSPIMAVIMYSTNSNIAHMIVITGITGDGSPGGTSLQINDPLPLNSGTSYTIAFNDFLTKFEQVVKFENKWPNSDLTSQFFYFKAAAKSSGSSSGDTSGKSSDSGSSSGDTSGKSSDSSDNSGDTSGKSSNTSDSSSSDDSGTSSDKSNSSSSDASDTSSGTSDTSSDGSANSSTDTSGTSNSSSADSSSADSSSADSSSADSSSADSSSADSSSADSSSADSSSADTSTDDSGSASSSDSGDSSSSAGESDPNK